MRLPSREFRLLPAGLVGLLCKRGVCLQSNHLSVFC